MMPMRWRSWLVAGLVVPLLGAGAALQAEDGGALRTSSSALQLQLEANRGAAGLTQLGWDTEGTGRATINLLKSPVELRLHRHGQALAPQVRLESADAEEIRFALALSAEKQLRWDIAVRADGMRMQMSSNAELSAEVDQVELVFPFDPRTAVTSIISSTWTSDGKFQIPAILSAPDLGQMLVHCVEQPTLAGRMEGSRSEAWLTVTFELPVPSPDSPLHLVFSPVVLPMPAGFHEETRWKAARRGWFNFIQQSCGASGGGSVVAGVWANNALSDPVSSVLYMLGDATLLVPQLAPGVSLPPILRRTVDYWIDDKTDAEGLVAYTAGGKDQNVMDSNPAVLIGAWSYVKASDDLAWLNRRIERLEFLSQYMEQRDIDHDGLIESKQSGDSGSRPPRDPDCAWDCYASGHKNAYVNTLAYRAWLGMADLEARLGRQEQERHYRKCAEQLKASFLPTFYNPETGWLGFWRSRDGKLHDLRMDAPTSLAIDYGLLEKEAGKAMLQRYWQALEQTGFHRFDVGVPLNLEPVPRQEMEYYTEFQQFLNGGCGVSNTAYLLNALYLVGMRQQADRILDAMLKRQQDGVFANGGGFQNGFVDHMGQGAEVFDWNGNPAGYEGHLVYCWAFLHSVLLKEPILREQVYPAKR